MKTKCRKCGRPCGYYRICAACRAKRRRAAGHRGSRSISRAAQRIRNENILHAPAAAFPVASEDYYRDQKEKKKKQ